MSRPKLIVPYQHRIDDLAPIFLAVTKGTEPGDGDWKPALRDTLDDGRLVVWVRGTAAQTEVVWVRDRSGVRQVKPLRGVSA